ncbi:MAG: carboxypeptidase regulatory-like domain-containing protein, partial [bacterium]
WVHQVGSENEGVEYRYQVRAVYGDGTELESEEVAGYAQMPPQPPSNIRVTTDSLFYTVTWRIPSLNADGSRCIDYTGCEIYLNDELITFVEAPDSTYQGEIPPGQEGWYTFKLIARDEVPNRSAPAQISVPLGYNFHYNFETATAIFSATPVAGGWERSRSLGRISEQTGPQYARSGFYAWGTRPGIGSYIDNANWVITTLNEYQVMSPQARVEFYHWYLCEQGRDGGQLQVSVDGESWELLVPQGGYPDQRVAAFGNEPAWTGASGDWTFVRADLSPFQGRAVRLRWVFKSDETDSWYPGWFIDDLTLWGVRTPRIGTIYGWIRDQLGVPVEGATIISPRGRAIANRQGYYRLPNLLAGINRLLVSKDGFVPAEQEITVIPNDSVRLDWSIHRPLLNVKPEAVRIGLLSGDEVEAQLRLANDGDFGVRWWAHLLTGDGDRDSPGRSLRAVTEASFGRDEPWEVLREFALGRDVGITQVVGAEFDGDRFYFSANDLVRGRLIAVVNREGILERTFPQPLPRFV